MKKLFSLFLALMILVTATTVFSPATAAAETFKAGDVLYLKVENPITWADNATLFANFTDATRAEYGRSIPIGSNNVPDRYHPVTGVTEVETRLYKYTVTAADAGATAMRFWRGSADILWNESVAITAAEYAKGNNMAVVSDWSDTGRLESKYDYSITASIRLSADKGEVGDSFAITVDHTNVPGADMACEIRINDTKVSDNATYTFTPDANGAYAVSAAVTAVDTSGKTLAKATASATITVGKAAVTAYYPNVLYAHAAADGAKDSEAWVKWYRVDDCYYFFLPSSAKAGEYVELYSSFSGTASLNGTAVPADAVTLFKADPSVTYTFTDPSGSGNYTADGRTRKVRFLFSSAEAALWVNNTEDYSGADFFSYLKANKSNSVAASGAISTPDGAIEVTDIKKMKGRGNTSWNADKKGFNITFQSALKVAGMDKCKKFSLISNFQDAAMARNRILYDMSDAVGIPYASDSRFIDLYTNGEYQGTYQMCQKIEVGKNALIPEFDEDDYLDAATGGVKSDFCFVAEIDSSPAEDDFHFTVQNGNNLTMKAPELENNDPNIATVRGYIKKVYNAMYSKLESNASDLDDYIDVMSLARVYLINELGKNWDSGASSFYLTYMPDSSGKYKFFASPVWDYDNSLGNARGVDGDLRRMGCSDYELPGGWFSTIKGGYNGPNFLATAAKSAVVMQAVYQTWFEDFLPAIDRLTSTGKADGELYSSDVYADILRDSAVMNYKVWELVTNSGWIADHSSLRRYTAQYTKNSYDQVTGVQLSQERSATAYDQYTFDGQFKYMMDWTTSRAAWISAQYISHYTPTVPPTEPPTQAPTALPTQVSTDAPTEQPTAPQEVIPNPDLTHAIAAWIFDATGKTEGEKLTEYGNADDGYAATTGQGTLTLSVDGEKSRALEWSAAEYGTTGTAVVPIMAAGSKNLWGSPYLSFRVSTRGYESIKFTAYLAGSNKAPASWKLQYSTDGVAFTDVAGAVATITQAERKILTAYLDAVSLPAATAGQEELTLRLVPVSMDTVSGGNTADKPSGGELAINYVVIEGTSTELPTDKIGDVDLNGTVEIFDATEIQRHLADMITLSDRQLAVADTDHSGEVEIFDVTMIQRYLADMIDAL